MYGRSSRQRMAHMRVACSSQLHTSCDTARVAHQTAVVSHRAHGARGSGEAECDQRSIEVMIEELDLLDAEPVVTPGNDDIAPNEFGDAAIPLGS